MNITYIRVMTAIQLVLCALYVAGVENQRQLVFVAGAMLFTLVIYVVAEFAAYREHRFNQPKDSASA